MVQLQNFFFLIIFMVVLCGTAAPVLFQWFLSRDVSTGAPFFDGTILPLFIPLLLVKVYIHSTGVIRSMDGAERIVLIRAKPLPSFMVGKSSSEIGASCEPASGSHEGAKPGKRVALPPGKRVSASPLRAFAKTAFFLSLFSSHFLILKFVGDLSSDLESFCGALCFFLFCTLFLSSNHGRARLANKGLSRARKRKRQLLRRPFSNEKQQENGEMNAEGRSVHSVLRATLAPRTFIVRIALSPRPGLGNASRWMRRELVLFPEPGNGRRRRSASPRYTLNAFSPLPAFPQAYPMVPGDEARDAFPVTPYGCNRGESALSSDWSVSSLARALLSKLQAVGHDFRETQPMNMKISHGGVCILITGVILSNTEKIQFTQLLPLGSELRIGKECCCLRGLDQLHGPTFNSICGNLILYEPSRTPGGDLFRGPENGQPGEALRASPASPLLLPRGLIPDPRYPFSPPPLGGSEGPLTFNHPPTPSGVRRDPFIFKHDESLRAIIDLLPIRFPAACGNGKLNHFFHGERWWMNRERNSCFPFWWTMFPEKRFSFSHRGTSTTKIAIHTNLFTDLYALMGTGSFETGWFLTIMKLPFICCIWIGFLLAFLGGLRSFLLKLAFDGSDWN